MSNATCPEFRKSLYERQIAEMGKEAKKMTVSTSRGYDPKSLFV